MAIALASARTATPQTTRDLHRWVVLAAVVVSVGLRLPFLNHAPSPDEAGFLMIGGQWHTGGSSLYGNYWVDRPPLLIGLFQLASVLGGLPALRLIGCAATGLIVFGSSVAAGQIAGRRASRWAAIAAAALSTTPLLGTTAVNGELLAGPFVVFGIISTLAALRAEDDRRLRMLATAAGASAMCALLVKQNIADVFVFGAVITVVAWHRGEISGRRAAHVIAGATTGAILVAYALAFVTSLHGTSVRDVFDAMYPFRLEAGRVMAEAGRSHAMGRLVMLLVAAAGSGMALFLAAALWGALSRRLRDAASCALLATLAFGIVSVGFGGNYWAHYLVEPIGPLAILTGVLVTRRQPLLRHLVALTAAASAATWAIWPLTVQPSEGQDIGRSIAASAMNGDTIVTAYGHADVVQASGLASPYRYLWSLPIKTLDPGLRDLERVLTGPQAPTWFVTWNGIPSWGLDIRSVQATVRSDYRPVARICGHRIYLRNGANRPVVRALSPCPASSAVGINSKDLP